MQQIDNGELAIILDELRKSSDVSGDVVEMGCYRGETSVELGRILALAEKTSGASFPKRLWLYDSFEGLPDKKPQDMSSIGDDFKVGELKSSKTEVIVRFKKAGLRLPIIKKAWFSELKSEDLPEKISFAFLDGDYYESIRDCLRLVEGKMAENGVIIVDDYASESLPGVAKAVDEWRKHQKLRQFSVQRSLAIIAV